MSNSGSEIPHPRKHHYIPKFYTKRWAGTDGKLCQIARYGERIVAKRRPPDGVGFKYDLYTVPGLAPEFAAAMEEKFLQSRDTSAAEALRVFEEGRLADLTVKQRVGWTKFMLSLLQRNPEKVAWVGKIWGAEYDKAILEVRAELAAKIDDPEAVEQSTAKLPETHRDISIAKFLMELMDLPHVGSHIVNMQWAIIDMGQYSRLMTSDRPLIIHKGVRNDDGFVAIAIGPSRIFFAVNSEEILTLIQRQSRKTLSARLNDSVVSQAHKYVYEENDTQIGFVANRLGRFPSQFTAPEHLLKKFPPNIRPAPHKMSREEIR